MQRHEYSMHEIARIVEGKNAQILSFLIASRPNAQMVNVMLKLNRSHELSGILSTFTRFGYSINRKCTTDNLPAFFVCKVRDRASINDINICGLVKWDFCIARLCKLPKS